MQSQCDITSHKILPLEPVLARKLAPCSNARQSDGEMHPACSPPRSFKKILTHAYRRIGARNAVRHEITSRTRGRTEKKFPSNNFPLYIKMHMCRGGMSAFFLTHSRELRLLFICCFLRRQGFSFFWPNMHFLSAFTRFWSV